MQRARGQVLGDWSRRRVLGAASAFAIGAVVPSRASANKCDPRPLRIRVVHDFETFDPADAYDADAVIARNIFAPLVRYKRRAGTGPGQWDWDKHLIESYSVSLDGLTQTFLLRNEVWSDGVPLTTHDVRFSFDRIAGRTSPAIQASNQALLANIAGTKVIDDRTIEVKLVTRDDKFILNVLPQVAGCIVPEQLLAQSASGKLSGNPGAFSGRYQIADREFERVTLCAQGTWRGDKPSVQSAEFIVIQNDERAQQAFKAGEIDVYRADRGTLQSTAQAFAGSGEVVRTSTSRMAVAAITTASSSVFADLNARQALQQVIDISAAVQNAYGPGEFSLQGGVYAPGWDGGGIDSLVKFDPSQTTQLKALGHRVRIMPSGDAVMKRLAAALADQLDGLGIGADLVDAQPGVYPTDVLTNGDIDVAVLRLPSSYIDDATMLSVFDYAKAALPDVGKFSPGDLANNAENRVSLQRILVDEGALLPLVEDHEVYVLTPGITPAFSPDGEIGDLGDWLLG